MAEPAKTRTVSGLHEMRNNDNNVVDGGDEGVTSRSRNNSANIVIDDVGGGSASSLPPSSSSPSSPTTPAPPHVHGQRVIDEKQTAVNETAIAGSVEGESPSRHCDRLHAPDRADISTPLTPNQQQLGDHRSRSAATLLLTSSSVTPVESRMESGDSAASRGATSLVLTTTTTTNLAGAGGDGGGECPSPPSSIRRPRYSGTGTKENPFVVDWDNDDPENPYNWSNRKRWFLTYQLALGTLTVTFGSSSYTGAIGRAKRELQMPTGVSILPISLYVFGFALGPLIFAPLSEIYGRRRIFLLSFLPFFLFQIPCALAPNAYVLIIFRFLAGTFGSSPLANAGGAIADIWPQSERGIATSLYSGAPWFGPIVGPLAGGFLIQAKLGWRWVFWIVLIMAFIPSVLGIFFMPETYAPVLLRRRAQKLQSESGDTIFYISKFDVGHTETVTKKLGTNLMRPFVFLFTEPIVTLLSLYIALLYGSLYATFIIFPIVFQGGRKWSPGFSGLSFLGLGVGVLIGVLSAPIHNQVYNRIASRQPGGKASPEARLIPAMVGSVLVPAGLFWFAWTNQPTTHYLIPISAGIPFGLGMLLVFTSVTAYLMDTYKTFTASALAALVVLRSILAALFPLFIAGLFRKIGNQWGASVFAFLALACMPLPFLFYFLGERVRMNSRVARQFAIAAIKARERPPRASSPSKSSPSQQIKSS